MAIIINPTDELLISLGNLLRHAAIASQAVIDAIPENVSIDDEARMIEVATAPVDELARFILQVSREKAATSLAFTRARAWMKGNYWATFKEAA